MLHISPGNENIPGNQNYQWTHGMYVERGNAYDRRCFLLQPQTLGDAILAEHYGTTTLNPYIGYGFALFQSAHDGLFYFVLCELKRY